MEVNSPELIFNHDGEVHHFEMVIRKYEEIYNHEFRMLTWSNIRDNIVAIISQLVVLAQIDD